MARRPGRGRNSAANDDSFDQGAPDPAPKGRGRPPKNGSAAGTVGDVIEATVGHNSKTFDGEFLAEALETIEAEREKMRAIKDAAAASVRTKCEPMKKKIKETQKALGEEDFPPSAVNALLRKRAHLRAATDEAITKNFDDEQKETFRSLEESLGPYIETPLGAAAARAGAAASAH